MGKRISRELDIFLRREYERRGHSGVKEMAEALDCSQQTVRDHIRRAGGQLNDKKLLAQKSQQTELIQLYNGGAHIQHIAAIMGVSVRQAQDKLMHLRKAGYAVDYRRRRG